MHANTITLIRTSDQDAAAQRALQRDVRRGRLLRIRPGVLADPRSVAELDDRGRHVLLVRASLPHIAPRWVLSGLSAAAVSGWPHIGTWPTHVSVTDPASPRTITTRWFVRRGSLGHPPSVGDRRYEGVEVTSGPQTVVDLAASLPFAESLALADDLLHRDGSLRARLGAIARTADRRHGARVARVLEHASGAAESPAESLCRARFIEIGASDFVEQQPFRLANGRLARVDFWFPDAGVVVEVDGRQKYEDPAMLGGTSTADALWREKLREDALRAHPDVRGFVRLTWADLMDPERVRAKLRAAGVQWAVGRASRAR